MRHIRIAGGSAINPTAVIDGPGRKGVESRG
jgi:hypothetical protein